MVHFCTYFNKSLLAYLFGYFFIDFILIVYYVDLLQKSPFSEHSLISQSPLLLTRSHCSIIIVNVYRKRYQPQWIIKLKRKKSSGPANLFTLIRRVHPPKAERIDGGVISWMVKYLRYFLWLEYRTDTYHQIQKGAGWSQ